MIKLHRAVWQQFNDVSEGSRSVSTKLHGVTTQKAATPSRLSLTLELSTCFHISGFQTPDVPTLSA